MSSDYAQVFDAVAGTANSSEYLLPAAANVVLQGTQITVTTHSTDIQHKPLGSANPDWTTIATSGTGAETVAVAAVPAGRVRFRLTSNNGTASAWYAVHYGRE